MGSDDPDLDDDYAPEDRPDVLDDPITCWCGATGTYDEMFDDDTLDETCGGTGRLQCFCGGDLCVCHHHGEADCPGCEDCGPDDHDDFDCDPGGEG